eukprot:7226597-Heterocapsa_arctica.AAC.1
MRRRSRSRSAVSTWWTASTSSRGPGCASTSCSTRRRSWPILASLVSGTESSRGSSTLNRPRRCGRPLVFCRWAGRGVSSSTTAP